MENEWRQSMTGRHLKIGIISIIIMLCSSTLVAQEKGSAGRPPAKVEVKRIESGTVAPRAEFVGTVYYSDISDVSAEVSGKVENVLFEEGQRVKKGQVLVRISADILEKNIASTEASYEQVLADLENARLDFSRIEQLYETGSIAEQVYDENRFRVKSLEKKAESLNADVERLHIEKEKKDVKAPFRGVVTKRSIDEGEWVAPGTTIARIARYDVVDIIVNVPERIIPFVKAGMEVKGTAGERPVTGKVLAVIPEGNIATRTFPVKIRVLNSAPLYAGMEARIKLPKGKDVKSLIVPRDAVIMRFGKDVIFIIKESTATMIPVTVIGYEGLFVGVRADGIEEGMNVVVKGHERLQDGQPVQSN
jgi:membrane fusion protein (multidrug efflux system)